MIGDVRHSRSSAGRSVARAFRCCSMGRSQLETPRFDRCKSLEVQVDPDFSTACGWSAGAPPGRHGDKQHGTGSKPGCTGRPVWRVPQRRLGARSGYAYLLQLRIRTIETQSTSTALMSSGSPVAAARWLAASLSTSRVHFITGRLVPELQRTACRSSPLSTRPISSHWRAVCAPGEQLVARMRVRSVQGRFHVTVTGELGGRDLRRLERACGPALVQRQPPLTLRLAAVPAIDGSARAYLERLVARGAVVLFD